MLRVLKARWKCASSRAVSPTRPIRLSHQEKIRHAPQTARQTLPSAHAVDREYKVITALGKIDFPVPRTYCLCEDESVVGTIFYVMDMVEGRILWDPRLPDIPREGRRAIFEPKFQHWQNCTMPITRRSGWAISANRAIIFPARFRAGQSNIKCLKRRASTR